VFTSDVENNKTQRAGGNETWRAVLQQQPVTVGGRMSYNFAWAFSTRVERESKHDVLHYKLSFYAPFHYLHRCLFHPTSTDAAR
jgi:hypothetical protein